ncbi:hypothetical protein AACH06_25485 [Ideonella sp. DXS29W]|uniref:Uncharacterized protein n=1 Tax=Ideonella lacteola TaxID=2984193 RepID=A0ABU9BW47_9BURK
MMSSLNQQEFLRAAMAEFGRLQGLDRPATRDEMCERLGVTRPTFDKWMLDSANGRKMSNNVWCHVREVLAHETLKKKVKKSIA